jgi:hypothetical protein
VTRVPDDLTTRRVLGRGLLAAPLTPGLDVGRDLALIRGPDGVDLATTTGMDNLAQCLEIALTTALGSDVFDTGFGFDGINALAGEEDPVLVRERIRVAVIALLGRDQRIRRIVDLKLLDGRLADPAAASAGGGDPAARIERWRTVEVQVAFEVVTGDRAVVRLAGAPAVGALDG